MRPPSTTAASGSRSRDPVGVPAGKDLLGFLAQGTAEAVGERFFQCLVEHVAMALGADVAFVAEVVPEKRARARFLACWQLGRLAEPVEYCMDGTPCAEVGDADIVSYPEGVLERFPDDEMVVELGLDSYLAVALRGSDGGHLGHLGVLATGPLRATDEQLAVLRIFASRAAAEVERRQQERALRDREASHRALAEEQAALRRVAMLVAAEAPQRRVLDRVVCEVGLLLEADVASLVRCAGDQGEIVAGWSRSPARRVPTGVIFEIESSSATKQALRTGRPARAEEPVLPDGDENLRQLGIRSAVAAPINVAGRRWGAVRVARTGEAPLPDGTEKRLGDFAELVAQAIANADAREQLAASRARLVQASDAARRRIERNLHDGAQQRLVSLALLLRIAHRRHGGDAEIRRVFEQLYDELALALEELRDLARGIHPAVLTDRGLTAALEALVARVSLPVELVKTPGERLPEAIEATAYYVVAEALTNVAKYAQATLATVSVTVGNGHLRIEVRDDGVGGAEIERGSGLRGLTDRVEAVHGTLEIHSPAGCGTVVHAIIPAAGAPTVP